MEKLNKKTEELIKKIAGSDVLQLVKVLKHRGKVSEIKLAEYCKKELNATRSILYKLNNFNFASFVKKHDKTNGFYIYYWSLDIKNINDFFINYKNEELKVLKKDLKNEESKKFYVCADNCVRFDFEKASRHGFKCPECNNLLDYESNEEKIRQIIEKINNLKTIT